jgi:DNA-binding transcriptional LysR family regulator
MASPSQIYDLDLKLLRYFCAIVEEGSFTAAQSSLNLSQSMLSESMKALEIRLGVRLCQRGPRGFKLFREGELVYEAAKELFAAVETFKQDIFRLNENVCHELIIGIQESVAENPQSNVSEAIGRFADYYPNVRFRIEIMLGSQMIGHVADGLLHVGIGIASEQFPQLAAERLFDEEAWICCGRRHPLFEVPKNEITLEQIESAAYCNGGQVEIFHPERLRNDNTRGDIGRGAHALLTLILSGRNVGYVPDYLARPYLRTGHLRTLRPEQTKLVNSISAITGPATKDYRLVQQFVDCLVDIHMDKERNTGANADVARVFQLSEA